MKQIKRIDISDFRKKGYLQEINRRFLHPLGLALEVTIDDNGLESLGGIWDSRDDEEGIYYDLNNSDDARKKRFQQNKDFIDSEIEKRYPQRKKILGFDVEPV